MQRIFRLRARMRVAVVALASVIVFAHPALAQSQSRADVWRSFAKTIGVGTEVDVHLRDGERFRATLIATEGDHLLVQPKTRVPVAVQPVPYDAITSLERHRYRHGAARAATIGAAGGAGGVLLVLWMLIASID